MFPPLRRPFCVVSHAGLFFEGVAQHGVQAAHFFIVAVFGGVDGFLCQIVAQDIERVDRVHACLALLLGAIVFTGDPGLIVSGPGIEAFDVDKVIA